ncbi:MAG: DUF5652 family protein [Patescibacteria group bacterium]|nr:DUF5652 family protein [Patescibacteria group bacterium]
MEEAILQWWPIIIWDGVWKAIALWKAAGNKQLKWYVVLFILNTAGVAPIIYLLFFDPKRKNKSQSQTSSPDSGVAKQ